VCLDAEAVRERRLTLADGAAFVIAYALGRNAVTQVVAMAHGNVQQASYSLAGLTAMIGLAAAAYVARRPAALRRRGLGAAAVLALGIGLAAAGIRRTMASPAALPAVELTEIAPWAVGILLGILVQEVLFRGIVQRSAEDVVAQAPRLGRHAAPALAAV